jgi:hypothetical protein
MDVLLGTYLTPTVILADTSEQAQAIAVRVRDAAKRPPLDALVASVRTLADVVPSDQDAKILVVERIRDDLTPRIRDALTDEQRKRVDRFIGKEPMHPLTPADLPDTFTIGLGERDGTIGRTVLVYPRPSTALWLGPPLAAFVGALRAAATVPGAARPGRVAGSLALSADIIDSIRRDGVISSAAAFFGVLVMVLALLRGKRSTLLVVGSLLLGVLWLAGLMMWTGIKINFANFIAFPITFGIGVDYSVNIMSRYVQDSGGSTEFGDAAGALRATGGAVALCSGTTIIGYSSLLIAQNRALYLFGLLAVLGEVCCLSTAIVTLPAVLTVLHRRAMRRRASAQP